MEQNGRTAGDRQREQVQVTTIDPTRHRIHPIRLRPPGMPRPPSPHLLNRTQQITDYQNCTRDRTGSYTTHSTRSKFCKSVCKNLINAGYEEHERTMIHIHSSKTTHEEHIRTRMIIPRHIPIIIIILILDQPTTQTRPNHRPAKQNRARPQEQSRRWVWDKGRPPDIAAGNRNTITTTDHNQRDHGHQRTVRSRKGGGTAPRHLTHQQPRYNNTNTNSRYDIKRNNDNTHNNNNNTEMNQVTKMTT